MHTRLREQLLKLGSTPGMIAARIGGEYRLVKKWLCGETLPSARYLARLHELGCDVIYILVGEKSNGSA